MLARPLEKTDYDQIVTVIDKWSGGPSAVLAHPVFFHELGTLAKVVEHEGSLVGFLFGFISERKPTQGYIHVFGIHPEYRRRGVGKALFSSFEQDCREKSCIFLRSITLPGNDNVVSFHLSQGFTSSVIDDYAGPGRPRVVFEKRL
jgi:GNAT superfamily N-acetyltransferase